MSAVRSDGELRSLRVIKRGEIQNVEQHHQLDGRLGGDLSEDLSSSARKRRRVMVDVDSSAIEESFYIEEVIEESEEESDSLDDLHKREIENDDQVDSIDNDNGNTNQIKKEEM